MIIFMVVERGGDFAEERWNRNIKAFTDRSKAESHIGLMQFQRYAESLTYEYVEQLKAQYRQDSPLPTYTAHPEPIPKWPAGIAEKDITEAMREERNSIKQRNKQRQDQAAERYSNWHEARRQWLVEHLACLKDNQYIEDLTGWSRSHPGESRFSIEECELD